MDSTSDTTAREELLREALLRMEAACEQLAATRSHEIYTAMIDGGQAQELLELDNARRAARELLRAGLAATPAPAELSFDQVLAAFDAITQEGKRQHVIVWGAMVSIQDIYNFIRVAHRAALAAPQAQEGHTCRPQYKMRELPDPDCKACTTVSRPPQAPIMALRGPTQAAAILGCMMLIVAGVFMFLWGINDNYKRTNQSPQVTEQ